MKSQGEYEFVVTEQDQVLLVLHAYQNDPVDPYIVPVEKSQKMAFQRDSAHVLQMNDVDQRIFELLEQERELLVCEIKPTENPEENEVVYTYFAEIRRLK